MFMLLISFLAKAEKTYRLDRSECTYKNQKITLELRGRNLYAERDGGYGEAILLKHDGNESKVKLNDNGIGRYKFLSVYNDICSKVLTLPIDENKLAFFILNDNRPFTDNVIVLYYNLKTFESEVVPSKFRAKDAFLRNGKAYFRLANDEDKVLHGTVLIDNQKFHYIEKTLEPWASFDGTNFKLDRDVTIEKFEYKALISSAQIRQIKDLTNVKFQVAFNSLLRKKCIALISGQWECK